MNSIESQFVPYEIAVKLKDLGFDWECIYCWGKVVSHDKVQYMLTSHKRDDRTDAPLFQQAFDYIREKGFDGEIYPNASGYCWTISKSAFNPRNNISGGTHVCDYDMQGPNSSGGYNTYESARLACLEKLIELVREKNK